MIMGLASQRGDSLPPIATGALQLLHAGTSFPCGPLCSFANGGAALLNDGSNGVMEIIFKIAEYASEALSARRSRLCSNDDGGDDDADKKSAEYGCGGISTDVVVNFVANVGRWLVCF